MQQVRRLQVRAEQHLLSITVDHVSGPWLPLCLQSLPEPGGCTCPSRQRPVSATLSSAHPDPMALKLR